MTTIVTIVWADGVATRRPAVSPAANAIRGYAMRKKANFKDDILEAAAGEPIQAIRIFDTSGYGLDKWRDVEPGLYRWAEVEALLDREYDDGWGSQDCPEIHAWTASMVLCIHEYDGSTYVRSLPRHPDVAS